MKTFWSTYYEESYSILPHITHLSMLEGRCNCAYFTDEATESLTSQESSSKRAIYNPDLQKLSASRSFVPNLSDLERKKKKMTHYARVTSSLGYFREYFREIEEIIYFLNF